MTKYDYAHILKLSPKGVFLPYFEYNKYLTKLLRYSCRRLSSRGADLTLSAEIRKRGTIFTKSKFVYYSVTNKLHSCKIMGSQHLYFFFNPRVKFNNDFKRLYVYPPLKFYFLNIIFSIIDL